MRPKNQSKTYPHAFGTHCDRVRRMQRGQNTDEAAMTRHLSLLLLPLAALLLAGCMTSFFTSPAETAQARMPSCYPIYYPYEERSSRIGDVRPVPDYGGWTDARMTRDAAAMAECGCAGCAVALTPQQLSSEDVQERLARFASIGARRGLRTTVLLYGQAGEPLLIDARNLATFLRQTLCVRMAEGILADSAGNAVLCYDRSSLVLQGGEAEDDGVRFRAAAGLHGDGPGDDASVLPVVWVADRGEGDGTERREQVWSWRQPRVDGEKMVEELLKTAADGRQMVLLQSWNRYSDGSFAERNSLDGEAIVDALKGLLRSENGEK